MIMSIIDVLTHYLRAVPISDEPAEISAQALIESWISIFGTMEGLLLDCGSSQTGLVVKI